MNVLSGVGEIVRKAGKKAALVYALFPGGESLLNKVMASLEETGVTLIGEIEGAAPNAPREDLARVTNELKRLGPDVAVSFGGGSTIDVTKSASMLYTPGGHIEDYFGISLVTRKVEETGSKLLPYIAIQTTASSGVHLAKYSNITDLKTGQKKLVVDEAVVPPYSIFDYSATFSSPLSLTADGALDGIAHLLEVLYGAVNKPNYEKVKEIAHETISLVVDYLPRVLKNSKDPEGRETLGLANDLGGMQ